MLHKWFEHISIFDLKPLNRFANTIKDNFEGVMNAIETGITNAVSEGLNSVMQLARGYRNTENFKAMIYFLGSRG